MIKTSPLLDIKNTLSNLKHVKHIHIVAVNNEVKELIWLQERDYAGDVSIATINIQKGEKQYFEFHLKEELINSADYSLPLSYIYEPNSSILKAGAFNTIGTKLNLFKLHKHSHLYTSDQLIEFPGRRFKVEKMLPYNKKLFAKEGINKANVTTRNFPLSVSEIRKKLKINDGGNSYLFFTTDRNHSKIILLCSKVL